MKPEIYKGKFKSLRKENGFTLVELVITIFVLSIGVIGIFSAFSIITILTSDSVNQLIATYLAQEGLEVVRNIRDTNWLNRDACTGEPCPTWVDGITTIGACSSSTGCEADYTSASMSGSSGDYLYLDSNGLYSYNSNSPSTRTNFERKITIKPVIDIDGAVDVNGYGDHIVKVTVQVSWDKKATILSNNFVPADQCDPSNCVTVEWMLYDWYDYARH